MNLPLLQLAAKKAWPQAKNTRGGGFIAPFEAHGLWELRQGGLRQGRWKNVGMDFRFRRSRRILGATFPKSVDISFGGAESGPLLAVSYKSILFSITSNVNNRWEEATGEAANLHSRFPMLVLGFLLVLPYAEYDSSTLAPSGSSIIIDASGQPTDYARNLESKFRGMRPRREVMGQPALCEEVALAVMDFSAATPTLHPSFPSPGSGLRIDNFFDKLMHRFRERNKFL